MRVRNYFHQAAMIRLTDEAMANLCDEYDATFDIEDEVKPKKQYTLVDLERDIARIPSAPKVMIKKEKSK